MLEYIKLFFNLILLLSLLVAFIIKNDIRLGISPIIASVAIIINESKIELIESRLVYSIAINKAVKEIICSGKNKILDIMYSIKFLISLPSILYHSIIILFSH